VLINYYYTKKSDPKKLVEVMGISSYNEVLKIKRKLEKGLINNIREILTMPSKLTEHHCGQISCE
jgi:hypothetical protein